MSFKIGSSSHDLKSLTDALFISDKPSLIIVRSDNLALHKNIADYYNLSYYSYDKFLDHSDDILAIYYHQYVDLNYALDWMGANAYKNLVYNKSCVVHIPLGSLSELSFLHRFTKCSYHTGSNCILINDYDLDTMIVGCAKDRYTKLMDNIYLFDTHKGHF